MEQHEVRRAPITLDDVVEKLMQLEHIQRRKNWIIFGLVVIVVVLSIGLVAVTSDHTAQRQNGRVADCRADEQAKTLDSFAIIVNPAVSDADKKAAAIRIADNPNLQARYKVCVKKASS